MKKLILFLIFSIVCSTAMAIDWQEELDAIYLSDLQLDPVSTGVSILATSYLVTQDEKIMEYLEAYNTPQVEAQMAKITRICDPAGTGIVLAAFAGLDQQLGYHALQSVALSSLSVGLLKVSLGLARPQAKAGRSARFLTLDDNYHSMPSGHTAVAFALAGSLARHRPDLKGAGYAAATLVGLSRLSLGKHWPSDVLLGAIIGTYCANRVGVTSPFLRVSF